EVLIPIQCEYYALEGLSQLLKNVELIQLHLNADLQVSTILLTMFDGRTRLAHDVADQVRGHFGDRVLRTVVPRSVRISEAPSHGETLLTYDPTSSGALHYAEAAAEMRRQEVKHAWANDVEDWDGVWGRSSPRSRRCRTDRGTSSSRGRQHRRTARTGMVSRETSRLTTCRPSRTRPRRPASPTTRRVWPPSPVRRSPRCGSTTSARIRGNPGRSSTRTTWPSWCTASASSASSSPSSSAAWRTF